MRFNLALALAGLGSSAVIRRTTANQAETRLLYQFPNSTFVENIAIRGCGTLLLNTFDDARLYSLDPTASEPTIQLAAKIPDITGLTGIAEISPDVFAVSGGVINFENYSYEPGTARITTVDFTQSDDPVLNTIVTLPDTVLINGLTALPGQQHVVLSIDAGTGKLYRINTQTGEVDVVLEDEALTPGENPFIPIGGNGIHIYQDYLYFTNTAQQFFGRVEIAADGEPVGEIEQVVHLPANSTAAYDDFTIDREGNSYVTRIPFSVIKISADGEEEIVVDESSSVLVRGPTAGVLNKDQSKLYVTTSGTPLEDDVYGGQVIEITL